MRWILLLVLVSAVLAGPEPSSPRPIDFDRIERKIERTPKLNKPLYGLFLFGEKKVWAVLDKSAETYDLLYIDRNADGDLTAKNECIQLSKSSTKRKGVQGSFRIGEFIDPSSGAKHTEFVITHTPQSIRFKMLWKGKQVTMGSYGPTRDTYVNFAPTLKEAPIFVPGYDLPLEFEHWMSGVLQKKASNDFKVFVGRRGSKRGAFSSSDDKFLPKGEYVKATLIYTDRNGKQKRFEAKLTERC
ncbi:MAG: hypothetical protein ACYS0E_01690 [Planctomycetota bacterium]|jgi:hypothetical protein